MTNDTYVTALPAASLFVDHAYQRPLDMPRAKNMAKEWDPRLVGIIDVSDRGEQEDGPRYAVIDGQHRWAAAALNNTPTLVVNVHTGLTVAEEARLFDRLNRERRRITTWDHWNARKAAGDRTVTAIERTVTALGLTIDSAPRAGHVRCTATLEKLHKLGGTKLIHNTLTLVVDVWGRDVAGFDAPLVHGIGLVLHHLRDAVETNRLYEAMLDVVPRQLKSQALALREMTTGSQPKLVAIAIMNLYNKRPGRRILVSTRTFGESARNAHSVPRQAVAAR